MSRDRKARRKSFLAALMLCMVSALALTVGIVYDKTHSNNKIDIADLNEPLKDEMETDDESDGLEDKFMFDDSADNDMSVNGSSDDISADSNNNDMRADEDNAAVADAGNEENTIENTDDAAAANAGVDGMQDSSGISDTNAQAETQAVDSVSEAAAAVSGTVNALHFKTDEKISWPVKGEVILPYSMEDTIYFPTLNVYKCNDAVMIKGEKDMPVCAAQEGVVEKVVSDREFGNMVVINMGDEYKALYGQLENVQVEEGQSIEKGQQIATLGVPTAYYESEGCNLYFKVTQNDKAVNPQELLE